MLACLLFRPSMLACFDSRQEWSSTAHSLVSLRHTQELTHDVLEPPRFELYHTRFNALDESARVARAPDCPNQNSGINRGHSEWIGRQCIATCGAGSREQGAGRARRGPRCARKGDEKTPAQHSAAKRRDGTGRDSPLRCPLICPTCGVCRLGSTQLLCANQPTGNRQQATGNRQWLIAHGHRQQPAPPQVRSRGLLVLANGGMQ
jgi:hypothetical protein